MYAKTMNKHFTWVEEDSALSAGHLTLAPLTTRAMVGTSTGKYLAPAIRIPETPITSFVTAHTYLLASVTRFCLQAHTCD